MNQAISLICVSIKLEPIAKVLKNNSCLPYGVGEDKKENGLDNDDPEELIITKSHSEKNDARKQKKLLEIAKIMFAEDFKKNE